MVKKIVSRVFPLRVLHRKILLKLRKKILRHDSIYTKVLGVRMKLPIRQEGIGTILAIYGERELDQYEILKHVIKDDDTILDVGSNIGYYPALERKFLGEKGHVYCMEPDNRNSAFLEENMHEHPSRSSYKIIAGAVADQAGEADFFLAKKTNLSALELTRSAASPVIAQRGLAERQYVGSIRVKLHAFLDLLTHEERSIDVVRMDIEGYEAVLLQTLASALEAGAINERAPRVFLFEPHSWEYTAENSLRSALERLSVFGYRVTYLGTRSEPDSPISRLGFSPLLTVKERRGVTRGVFSNIPQTEAIRLATEVDGVTTVCLERIVGA